MRKFRYLVIIFMSLLVFVGCDEKLDLKPTDEIDETKAFEVVEDLESGIIGVYASLFDHGHIDLSARASDDLKLSPDNTGQGVQTHSWTYSPGGINDAAGLWSDYYHSIDRANRVLVAAEKFADDPNQAIVNKVKGEALFIRAYCHFQLVRVFCGNYSESALGVPVVTEPLAGATPARDNQSLVYDQIKSDLTEAATLLTGQTDRTKASEFAAKALAARVALYQGDWDKAISLSTEVISNSGISIADQIQFVNIWDDSNTSDVEVIFKFARSEGDAELGAIFNRTGNTDVFFEAGRGLMSMYDDENDVRSATYFLQEDTDKFIVIKYLGRGSGKNLVDEKVLRISEMYLIRAEAYAQKSDLTNSAQDIETIRLNRIANAGTVAFATQTDAMTQIRLERRKELAYEGHRFYDLKRWELGITRTETDCLLSACELGSNDYHFVFPIPQAEMFANDNMVQNPSYENE